MNGNEGMTGPAHGLRRASDLNNKMDSEVGGARIERIKERERRAEILMLGVWVWHCSTSYQVPLHEVLCRQRSRYSVSHIFSHSDLDEAHEAKEEYSTGEEAQYQGNTEEIADGGHYKKWECCKEVVEAVLWERRLEVEDLPE